MSRVICHIDLAQLCANIEVFRNAAGSCAMMPVLKYDAYGLGALKIGAALKKCGAVKRFAAATLEEAVELKQLGLDVQILGVLPDDEIAEAVQQDIICPVCDRSVAFKIAREAQKQNKTARIAVKLDTGMGRLGFIPERDLDEIIECCQLPGLVRDGLFAHFSTAAVPDLEYANYQIGRFKNVFEALKRAGIDFIWRHHGAGDATLKIPGAVAEPFNLVRPGGLMYGENFDGACKQIITLRTKIGAVRELPPGSSIGYYRTFTTERVMRVAILAAGYADGIPLALSNRGEVLIHGKRCPILGRVAMDYTAVDISDVPEAVAGDDVVLLGRQGGEAIPIDLWGKMKSTHCHDIWCAIGRRVKRIYTE